MSVEKMSLAVFNEMCDMIGQNRMSREAFLSAIARGMHAVIEEEREACAKIADEEVGAMNGVFIESTGNRGIRALAARDSAARVRERIRARSNVT